MTKYTFVFMLFDIKPEDLPSEESDHILFLKTQLRKTKTYENVNIVVVNTAFVNLKSSNSKTFKTVLSWFKPESSEGFNYKEQKLKDLGNINIGSGDTLGMIFSFIKFHFPSERIIIYSNNHSNHFGGLSKQVVLINDIKFAHILSKVDGISETGKPAKKKPMPVIELPHIDMLTYNELSTAIKNGFIDEETPKIDLLVTVACYGTSIDNLVIFKDSVDYLFSSESVIFFDVINLSKLIENIVDRDSISGGLSLLFSNFEEDWKGMEFGKFNKKAIFSVLNLKKEEQFVDDLNALLKFIIDNPALLQFIRNQIPIDLRFPFSDTSNIVNTMNAGEERHNELLTRCIDFIHFLNTLNNNNVLEHENKSVLSSLIETLKKDIESMTAELFLNTRINKIPIKEAKLRPFYGISCFLPIRPFPQDLSFLDPNTFEQMASSYSPFSKSRNSFAKRTLWPELIQAIYKTDQTIL